MEYTLVFRRAHGGSGRTRAKARPWTVVRPALPALGEWACPEEQDSAAGGMARVFVVPICSALDLDGVAYEHFLVESGAVEMALRYLGRALLDRPRAVINARKEIQALVMAAEVQHIVNAISA
jgi:hypothetical protein